MRFRPEFELPEKTKYEDMLEAALPELRKFEGFVAVALFGSAAVPKRCENPEDIDAGIIGNKYIFEADLRDIQDVIEKATGLRGCDWNNPNGLFLNIQYPLGKNEKYSDEWYDNARRDLEVIPRAWEYGGLRDHTLKVLTRYCLPFARCVGDTNGVLLAKNVVEKTIGMSKNREVIAKAVNANLKLMYRTRKEDVFRMEL